MQRPLLCAGLVSNRMARKYHNPPPYSINAADDEYIDIEVMNMNSFSPESRSFEFQMSSVFTDKQELNIFPADDLFYKGKLLPLLLPPRLQTLQDYNNNSVEEDDFIIMDFATSPSPSSNTSTPLKPCRLSFDYFESSTGLSTFINNKHPGKFWSNKLRLIKKCLISKKLKASRAYLRSLFRKSACIDVSSAKAAEYNNPSGTDKQVPNGKCFHLKYSMKVEHKKTPFVGSMGRWRHPIIAKVVKRINKEGIEDKVMMSNHRRSLSFSSSAEYKRRRSPIKCLAPSSSGASSSSFSSSSISFSSSDFYELNFHNRSCSFASDFEGSIEAAITHCKKSQGLPNNPRKTFIEAGHFALSAPRIATS